MGVEPVHQAPVEAVVFREGGPSEKPQDEGHGGETHEPRAPRGALRRGYFSNRDRRKESVSAPRQCLQVDGRARRVPERHPDPANTKIEAAIEIHVGIVTPDRLSERIPRHQLAGTSGEELQHASGVILELDPLAVSKELPGLGVEPEGSEPSDLGPHERTIRRARPVWQAAEGSTWIQYLAPETGAEST